ncbi:TetR/AcrR family transcriptional regulator [Telmatospirillum sp.]|uniref:TetR/AcrR family transcriptional regulator n=1 Tax=Telmatospirillum sp. TaxID=2079197 RepID=UPI0028514409|nr:TetR/AcrR family transcriptional regulator [Telmatospirillum sp.]MDR3439059.1 TetR/AcrR family transcriptional regulator [Telmatospirillum sp.]
MTTTAEEKRAEERGESCRAKAAQISAAARHLFMGNGYRCTSMDQIAHLADVSKTTLYAYFPSKEALFLAMIEAEKLRLGLQIPEEIPEGPIDVRGLLSGIARVLTNLMTDQSLMGLFRTVLAESGQSPELGRAIWDAGPKRFSNRIAVLLERLSEAGYLKVDDPSLAASRFLALVRGDWHLHTLMDCQFVPDKALLNQHADQAVDWFLQHYR